MDLTFRQKSDASSSSSSSGDVATKSRDPCGDVGSIDRCTGSCHLVVDEYSPSQLKHLSREQKLKNLAAFGDDRIKNVRCRSRHPMRKVHGAASSPSKKKRAKPVYSGDKYWPA